MARPKGSHLDHGRWGEDVATEWYRRHGYEIVARNWRCPAGEVDLVARRRRLLVIAEVKARRSDAFGPAAAAVGRAKQLRLRRLAAEFLRITGTHGVEVRFDVVAITGSTMHVIQHAF